MGARGYWFKFLIQLTTPLILTPALMLWMDYIRIPFNSSQLTKWTGRLLTCLCHKIYSAEAIGLSIFSYALKIAISVNMWNLRKLSENFIFLLITAFLKFESKNSSAHVWHRSFCLSATHTTLYFYFINFDEYVFFFIISFAFLP